MYLELEINEAFAQVVGHKLVPCQFKAPHVAAVVAVGLGGKHREVHVVEQAVNEFVVVLIVELVVGDLDVGAPDVAPDVLVGIDSLAEESEGLVIAILVELVVADVDVVHLAAQPQVATSLAVVVVADDAILDRHVGAHAHVIVGDHRIGHVTVHALDVNLAGMIDFYCMEA